MEMFQAYRIHALASAASESIVGAIFTKRPAQSWRTLFDTSVYMTTILLIARIALHLSLNPDFSA